MKPEKKLTKTSQTEEQQAVVSHQEVQNQSVREFATVEDLLRQDARATPIPGAIAERLEKTIGQIPPSDSRRAWWRRLFGA
jgi:hypothetical protein